MSPSQQLSGLAMTTSGALRWLLAGSLLAAACTTGPDLTPVQQPGQRMQFDGFSVLPPQGERWYVAPTLTIRPGFPVRIVVTRDLVLEPYGG